MRKKERRKVRGRKGWNRFLVLSTPALGKFPKILAIAEFGKYEKGRIVIANESEKEIGSRR